MRPEMTPDPHKQLPRPMRDRLLHAVASHAHGCGSRRHFWYWPPREFLTSATSSAEVFVSTSSSDVVHTLSANHAKRFGVNLAAMLSRVGRRRRNKLSRRLRRDSLRSSRSLVATSARTASFVPALRAQGRWARKQGFHHGFITAPRNRVWNRVLNLSQSAPATGLARTEKTRKVHFKTLKWTLKWTHNFNASGKNST